MRDTPAFLHHPHPTDVSRVGWGNPATPSRPTPARPTRSLRSAAALFVCAAASWSPLSSWGASATGQTGAQLLQAQLPNGTAVAQADCEQLTRAVNLATRAHRTDAPAILTAAISRPSKKDRRHPEATLPCACVTRLLRASMTAAPEKASSLLELASSLYPDCADSLQAAVAVFDDKNVVDDKNGPAARSARDGARDGSAANGPANGNFADGSRPDSNAPEGFDPGAEANGFGVGFGPGFPGSPGFTGSPPSGAISLPPASNPVTNVQNG